MMKKKALLVLLTIGTMLTLAACGNSSSGGKKCNGGTCQIGYRYHSEKVKTDIVIR